MEVRIGLGLDRFVFGQTQSEIISALGPADKQYATDSGRICLQYFDLRVEFSFSPEEENRLGWIEVYNPAATLFGHLVVGEQVARITKLTAEALGEEPEHKDFGSLETFFFPKAWLELQVTFGRVVCVSLGVVYDERDEPIWPDRAGLTLPACDAPGT